MPSAAPTPAQTPEPRPHARAPFWLVAFPPWLAVILVIAASAFVLRPAWLGVVLWPALPWIAYVRGASRTYFRALRRLTVPSAIILSAGAVAPWVPDVFGTVLVLAGLLAATWQARMARYTGSSALGLPLLILAATLIWRIWAK